MVNVKLYIAIVVIAVCVVCACVFGKSIVFPNSDDVDAHNSTSTSTSTSATNAKPVSESRNIETLFSDGNGSLDIPTAPSPPAISQSVAKKNKTDLFPKPRECGPMLVGVKIHGGEEAELGEFPWLVNLEYRTEYDELEIGCAGNILNHRYVLTAAHCVKGPIEETFGTLESMRVGDHNTRTAEDCDDLECIDPYQRFSVVERIVHGNYSYSKKRRIFADIALLKTDRSITYSYSVAPVCLPNVMGSLEPPGPGARMSVAGWGHNGTVESTDEKRIVELPYAVCSFRKKHHILCAGGESGKDSCAGDSGGSLARRTEVAWVMEGIVSFGSGCGSEKPAVYTRIRSFLQWIEDHVEEP